jgi:hypothetical protein
MPQTEFHPVIAVTERSQNYALDLVVTGIGGLEI